MLRYKLSDMKRGWFIGDFNPSILKTKEFEVGYLFHKKNEKWPVHLHEKSIEYNVLIKGKMRVNGETINEKEIFIFEKNEIVRPEFLEDCELIVVKVPSLRSDKVIVD